MNDAERLAALSMVPQLSAEVVRQIGATAARAPTLTVRGGVLQQTALANVTPAADGTAVGTAFNSLLVKLRAAGILAT